jgi:hypothetical protein
LDQDLRFELPSELYRGRKRIDAPSIAAREAVAIEAAADRITAADLVETPV